MKGKLIVAIGGGAAEAGGGIVINAIWGSLLWLGFLLIGVGILSIILGFTWRYVVECARWIQLKTKMILRVITQIKESNEYLLFKDEQQKNPAKWLFPVIDHIDLNRKGGDATKNDAFIRFWVDSHLLCPINEYYVFVKLCLRDESQSGFPEVETKDWYELKQEGKYPPIQRLERHPFAEYKMHLEDKDNELLELMENFREGHRVLATLKIRIVFKQEEKGNPICLEGSRWIVPMNDYRGE